MNNSLIRLLAISSNPPILACFPSARSLAHGWHRLERHASSRSAVSGFGERDQAKCDTLVETGALLHVRRFGRTRWEAVCRDPRQQLSWAVIATSENGFPWEASLGANADNVVFIPESKTATAISRESKGPVYVAHKSTLGEVSFIALGADDDTTARLEAGSVRPEEEDADQAEDSTDELEPVNASLDLNKNLKSKAV